MDEMKIQMKRQQKRKGGRQLKKNLLSMVIVLAGMLLCLTGCSGGGGNKIVGTYSGTTGQSRGTRSSTLVFEGDGTCSYEYVHAVTGKGEITEKYTGVWTKSKENDNYEIMLNGMGATLYGKLLDSGDIVVSSDGFGWTTETFSKE